MKTVPQILGLDLDREQMYEELSKMPGHEISFETKRLGKVIDEKGENPGYQNCVRKHQILLDFQSRKEARAHAKSPDFSMGNFPPLSIHIEILPGKITVINQGEKLGFIQDIHLGSSYKEKYVTIAAPQAEAEKYPKVKRTIDAFTALGFEIRYDETVDGHKPGWWNVPKTAR